MKLKHTVFTILLLAISSAFFSSCKKFKGASKGNLEFSADTLVFDTVFTTIGSTTHQFKIYNKEKGEVTIDEVELMGGASSPFRMNLDGLTGTSFSELKLKGGDSLFCFVEVTLNINGQILPMVVEDSIRFRTNGVDQYVRLAVWGQDMYYHYSNFQAGTFDLNEGTWPNDKPHVIYGAAVVDSAKTLDIPQDTKIYLHKNSILYNYKGTLNIHGTKDHEVILQGDRLEQDYADVSGQYYGIYFQEARPSTIDYAIIKNATAGIHVFSKDAAFSGPTVTIKNTKIYNAASYGLFLYAKPEVVAENTLVHSNGVHSLIVLQGATFTFTHCDFLGYGAGDQTTPAVGMTNYYTDQTGTTTVSDMQGEFRNCVIYGYGDDQLALDTLNPNGNTVNIDVFFKNCVIKTSIGNDPMFTSCIKNSDPLFSSINSKNFDFSSLSSPLNNAGSVSFPVPSQDIDGNPRNTPPDIGAYEN